MSQDQTHPNPRLAVLRELTRGDGNDLWRLVILEKLDAVDPARQPVSMDAVEAARSMIKRQGWDGWVCSIKDSELSDIIAAADAARGRDTEANAPPPTYETPRATVWSGGTTAPINTTEAAYILAGGELHPIDRVKRLESRIAALEARPEWTEAKEIALRQLARQLWSDIRRAAFPEGSDEAERG